MAVNGLELITPTSIAVTGSGSSATINAGGSVTFATAATLSLNGVFSSTYDNYIVDMRTTRAGSGTEGHEMRLRVGGVDASGGNYTRQLLLSEGTLILGDRSATTQGRIGISTAVGPLGFQVFIYGPSLAQPTAWRSVTSTDRNTRDISEYVVTHNVSTAYDGLTLFPTAGSFTGLIKVYGLAQ